MVGEGRFSHLIVISLGDVCIHLFLLQQEARSGYAPAMAYDLMSIKCSFVVFSIVVLSRCGMLCTHTVPFYMAAKGLNDSIPVINAAIYNP